MKTLQSRIAPLLSRIPSLLASYFGNGFRFGILFRVVASVFGGVIVLGAYLHLSVPVTVTIAHVFAIGAALLYILNPKDRDWVTEVTQSASNPLDATLPATPPAPAASAPVPPQATPAAPTPADAPADPSEGTPDA